MLTKVRTWVRKHLMFDLIICFIVLWWTIASAVYFIESKAPQANIRHFGDSLWWGLVTILTVGYGDFYPVTIGGRTLGGILMVAGVVFIGILTARISSYFLEKALRIGRGDVDTSTLRDHFIVCGWKDEMHEILTHILDFNPGLESDQIVLVASLPPPAIDEMRAHPRLHDLQVINGEYFHEVNLRRAGIEKARKILILADRSRNAQGQMASVTEVDARTVMTAMTISNIARGTLVAAELLDPKMEAYLRLAHVSEIIYSREYSRLLLGNASAGTGIANVIFDLLNPKTPTVIATRALEENQIGLKYLDFRSAFSKKHPECVLIGILENTGNEYRIKDLALRQAQKTPDVNVLVLNLRKVKELRCNNPIFNPRDDYSIPAGSMAIVLETRRDYRDAA